MSEAVNAIANFMNPVISAAAGLIGVLLGSWLTVRRERSERRYHFITRQLDEFYAPFYALRQELRAKGETRVKISTIAQDTWANLFEKVEVPSLKREYHERYWPQYESIIAYNNDQIAADVVPTYHAILRLFREKIGLANEPTRVHYRALVEFIEIWDRFLKKSLPAAVTVELQHNEESLYPLYDEVEREFVRLQGVLKDGGARMIANIYARKCIGTKMSPGGPKGK